MNVICAYTVNLDEVCNVQAQDLSPLIPPELSSKEMGFKLKGSIARMEDLISSLLFCMREGSGAEILIESPDLANQIKEAFSWKSRLGGNAGIMANILAHLGAKPTLNAPALGPTLAAMLHPEVRIPLSGALAEPRLVAEEMQDSAEPVHFVFQFRRGVKMAIGRDRFTLPQDNRFIASYDPINTSLKSGRDFDSYCQENISHYAGALVSGFHLVPLPKYRKIFGEKMDQLKSWKESNPNLFIHLELGSFQSPQIMSHLLNLMQKVPIDSLGMNQDELGAAAGLLNVSTAMTRPGSWQESILAADRLQDKTGIFRVAIHTGDYILSVMQEGRISAQDELSALQSGADAAASLAACGSVRAAPPEQFNEKGLKAAAELRRQGADCLGRGAMLHSGGRIVSLAPARQASQPLITVGLGDTATASIFFREVGTFKGNFIPAQ